MTKPRLIPCLLLKNGLIVRSERFRVHQNIGNPVSTVSRLCNWNVDELVVLDIGTGDTHDRRREDHGVRYKGDSTTDVLGYIAEVCFMPLAFGGRIRSLDDMRARLAAGADKCVINTLAVHEPGFVSRAAREFGSQCVVISIDTLRHEDGRLEVFTERGRVPTGMAPTDWAKRVEDLGAGEIFLNSIDRDGTGRGYDLDLIRGVADAVAIPVIACGGVQTYEDFAPGILEGGASAVSAANIFNFFELSYPRAKKACLDTGLDMREVGLNSRWFPREPFYDREREDALIAERLERAGKGLGPTRVMERRPLTRFCARCVYSSASASYMEFDEDGVCMGCRTAENKVEITPRVWKERLARLQEIAEWARCRDGSRHDCVIGVSGGKDSYFQAHVIKNDLGLNPLLVTYYGNNYTEAGHRNLYRMKEVFGCDHVVVYPSVETLEKLNRLGFIVMGDMNWHAHLGIATTPMKVACERGIPLVIWGEHGEMDLSGQFSMSDFIEFTYRNRLEHEGRSFEWNYFVGREGLKASDMAIWQYPSDDDMFRVGLRGIYLANYVYWEANDHLKMVVEKYGFEQSDEPFDRTYRRGSNLDDMHENGVHDYLKFIKFGYGRCSDHATKDIRAGLLSRGQAVDLVRKHDHVKPRDLGRWLDYVGMTEKEFDAIANTFRDPRVWSRDDSGAWQKDNVWD